MSSDRNALILQSCAKQRPEAAKAACRGVVTRHGLTRSRPALGTATPQGRPSGATDRYRRRSVLAQRRPTLFLVGRCPGVADGFPSPAAEYVAAPPSAACRRHSAQIARQPTAHHRFPKTHVLAHLPDAQPLVSNHLRNLQFETCVKYPLFGWILHLSMRPRKLDHCTPTFL